MTLHHQEKVDWKSDSKVGSLDNIKHKPKGGKVKIFNEKPKWNAQSKIGSMKSLFYSPERQDLLLEQMKKYNEMYNPGEYNPRYHEVERKWNMLPKIGSADDSSQSEPLLHSLSQSGKSQGNGYHGDDTINYKTWVGRKKWNSGTKVEPINAYDYFYPSAGEYEPIYRLSPEDYVKYKLSESQNKPKQKYENVKSKVGSLDNIRHSPGGGTEKVFTEKLQWNAEPKIDSIGNLNHQVPNKDKHTV